MSHNPVQNKWKNCLAHDSIEDMHFKWAKLLFPTLSFLFPRRPTFPHVECVLTFFFQDCFSTAMITSIANIALLQTFELVSLFWQLYHFKAITRVDQSPQQIVFALCFMDENALTSEGLLLSWRSPCPSWP